MLPKFMLPKFSYIIVISSDFPLVRETIRQYISNLKMFLNIMDTNSSNELLEIATSKEYYEAALSIISNSWDIEVEIRRKFVESLRDIVKSNNLEMTYDEGICELEDDTFVYFYSNDLSEKWAIVVGADRHKGRDGGVYYGITYRFKPVRISKKQLSEISNFWEGDSNSSYPYGWSYLSGENGQGNWWNWYDTETLKDMANGKLVNYIENEIIKPVMNNKLLEKIEGIFQGY